MAVIGKFRSAKLSRVSIGGVALNLASWDITRAGDDLDTNCFENAGEDQGTIGIVRSEYTAGGLWDAGKNAFDNPPGLFPRDDLLNLRLYENINDNVFHLIAQARVISAKNSAQVKDTVKFEFSGKSNGGITLATGSV